MKALRWQVNRVYLESEPPVGDSAPRSKGRSTPTPRRVVLDTDPVEVTITPATRSLMNLLGKGGPKSVLEQPADQLTWWNTTIGRTDREPDLEGWTRAGELLAALTQRNLAGKKAAAVSRTENRTIREDMVFLQIVRDDEAYDRLWRELRRATGLPDVTRLVAFRKAHWTDFTRPARQMAKDVYRKALEERQAGP